MPDLAQRTALETASARFDLEYTTGDDGIARDVEVALKEAVPRVERWGRFAAPVSVRIHPTHDALEQAVHRIDYPWLRAWARYDSIDMQSPRTWSLLGASHRQLVELLTHELTHCLMYQGVAGPNDWARKSIPLWFREGMASFTAEQGYRRPGENDLKRYLDDHPGKDPITDGDKLYRTENEIVYGAAHRAFAHLVRTHGESSVVALIAAMREGLLFAEAFTRVIGVDDRAFARDFIRSIVGEAPRG